MLFFKKKIIGERCEKCPECGSEDYAPVIKSYIDAQSSGSAENFINKLFGKKYAGKAYMICKRCGRKFYI